MKKSELPGIPTDNVVVRLFINGQYMSTARIIDAHRSIDDKAVIIDADFEIFEMEKK